ncbi:MAG: hypothetical protein ABEN55_11870 [Bradymonadaceae bacterium]
MAGEPKRREARDLSTIVDNREYGEGEGNPMVDGNCDGYGPTRLKPDIVTVPMTPTEM